MVMKLCPLPEGNDSEHPFPLLIHGAAMLGMGIEEYAQNTAELYTNGDQDAAYCFMRTCTAAEVAEKLRAWAIEVEPEYLESLIAGIDDLLKKLASEKQRLLSLAEEERAKRPPSSTIDISSLFKQD